MHPERIIQLENLKNLLKESGDRKRSPFYTLKATAKRVKLLAKLFRKAYREDTIVAWRNLIMPTEIFYAYDITPFCTESVAAMLAGNNLSSRFLDTASDNNYSVDCCSFLRCIMGAVIEDCLPTPDFLACTSYYCDGACRVFDGLRKNYKKELFFIDIPYDYPARESIDYVASQLEEMTIAIGDMIGKKIDLDRLAEVINLSNQAREYWVRICQLRRNSPAPVLGGEAIDYATVFTHAWGTKELVEIYKLLYEELKEQVERDRTDAQPEKKHRILWRHLRPYYSDNLLTDIETRHSAVVAFEEVNHVHWGEMDTREPYKSLAKKILGNLPVGKINHWIEDFFYMVECYKIDAVISFAHRGCRQLNSSVQILKDVLNKKDIPLLELDGDCVDSRDYSEEQSRIRINSFIELLQGNK
ncbi:MAG: 2-hydroxyacyl-CoA dehydratase family protein [bacterium]